jgi:hypothetical protein
MSSINRTAPAALTVNSAGTSVKAISAEKQLRRLTMAHMLWEDQFYVDGKSNAQYLADVLKVVDPKSAQAVAIEAREKFKLRHVPLLIMRELARVGKMEASALASVIQRPDEIGEFISLYWKEKKQPLSNQVKKGLAQAFSKFNEYQFAKWNKNSAAVKLRDALFLVHAKPVGDAQTELFKKIAEDSMKTPDTWETELSAGADKKATFTRLMQEKKLGALAFLRNLRNMEQAGVSESMIRDYAKSVNTDRVLPFRFIAAAKHAPRYESMLEEMMLRSLASHEKLPGRTVLVVDTSGSMGQKVSAKSELTAMQAAAALAILAREICEDVVIYATAGSDGTRKHATMLIPPRRGFALSDFITGSEVQRKIGGGGIFFVQAMEYIAKEEAGNGIDRVIVFTDEQDTSAGGRNFNPSMAKRLAPGARNYIVNVGTNKNGINSKEWESITGFSEAIIDYIQESERA